MRDKETTKEKLIQHNILDIRIDKQRMSAEDVDNAIEVYLEQKDAVTPELLERVKNSETGIISY